MNASDPHITSTDEAYSRYYAQWYTPTPQRLEAIFGLYDDVLGPVLPADPQARVLDVGCGTGMLLRWLMDRGYSTVSGVEVNPAQRDAAGPLAEHIAVTADTARWLAERAGQFDVITALDVLEHVPRAAQTGVAASIRTALRPGGQFICTVPNASAALGGRWRYNDYTHLISFTENSLQLLLDAAGFTDILIEPSEIYRLPPEGRAVGLKRAAEGGLRRAVRLLRRLECIGEFGLVEGRSIPLSLNIRAVSRA